MTSREIYQLAGQSGTTRVTSTCRCHTRVSCWFSQSVRYSRLAADAGARCWLAGPSDVPHTDKQVLSLCMRAKVRCNLAASATWPVNEAERQTGWLMDTVSQTWKPNSALLRKCCCCRWIASCSLQATFRPPSVRLDSVIPSRPLSWFSGWPLWETGTNYSALSALAWSVSAARKSVRIRWNLPR